MNIVRRHTATIVVAMVTAAATAGGTAIAGQIINADKLEGYRADQLIRAAEKHRNGGVLRSARGDGARRSSASTSRPRGAGTS